MPHKDFTIVQYDNPDPPSFSLTPETKEGEATISHQFVCIPVPPGGVIADIFLAFQGDITVKTAGCVQLIKGCLSDEDEARFDELIHDKHTVIRTDKLSEIALWIIEEYTAPRPTTPSSGSVNGSPSMPATSEGGADSQESTSKALVSSN